MQGNLNANAMHSIKAIVQNQLTYKHLSEVIFDSQVLAIIKLLLYMSMTTLVLCNELNDKTKITFAHFISSMF